jgi:hypothetical protein
MAKFITLKSEFKSFQFFLVIGIVLLPLGVGILLLLFVYLKQKTHYWEIHPSHIFIKMGSKSLELALNEIKSVTYSQSNFQKKAALANLHIESNKGYFTQKGIKQAKLYADSIQLAIDTIKAKNKPSITVRPEEHADLAIGGLERMNDLVGLWQAGMISDEDFYAEQERFKRNA